MIAVATYSLGWWACLAFGIAGIAAVVIIAAKYFP